MVNFTPAREAGLKRRRDRRAAARAAAAASAAQAAQEESRPSPARSSSSSGHDHRPSGDVRARPGRFGGTSISHGRA